METFCDLKRTFELVCSKLNSTSPLDGEPRAGLFPGGGVHVHAARRVVVDHPVVLIPEDVLWGDEAVLDDADEGYDGALRRSGDVFSV